MEAPEQVPEVLSSAESSSISSVSRLENNHIYLRRQFRTLVRVVVQLSTRVADLAHRLCLQAVFSAPPLLASVEALRSEGQGKKTGANQSTRREKRTTDSKHEVNRRGGA